MDYNFELKSSEDLGDFLVSMIDVDEWEVIHVERPLFISPRESNSLCSDCCVTCMKIVDPSFRETEYQCPNCNWPVCSSECAQDKMHHAECRIFSDNQVEYSKARNGYLKVIRIILAQGSPEFQSFTQLSSGIGMYRDQCFMNEANASYDFLKNVCGMDVTLDDIVKVLSILKINRFMFESQDPKGNNYEGYAVFNIASKFAHSCAPNVEWQIYGKFDSSGIRRFQFRLLTKSKIRKGDILSISYSLNGVKLDTCRRRKLILSSMSFDCLCSRCKSITEEGTFFGGTLCQICGGDMLPMDALNGDCCFWKCEECEQYRPGHEISQIVSNLDREITRLTEMEPNTSLMNLVDEFIERNAGRTLHKNHFVLLKGYEFWLFQGKFSKVLLGNDEQSKTVFEKIKERAEIVRLLNSKFWPISAVAGVDFFLAQKIAEFVFKSSDHRTINYVSNHPLLNAYYGKKVLSYLTKSLEWAELNPQNNELVRCAENLRELQEMWTDNVEDLSRESNSYDYITNEAAFSANDFPLSKILPCLLYIIMVILLVVVIFTFLLHM